MKLALFAALALASFASAADKKDWNSARVEDVQIIESGYQNIGNLTVPIRQQQLLISGEFLYTVGRVHGGYSRCRFVVGDETKYRQDKNRIRLIDADGKECTGEIVRQERIPAKP